MLNRLNNRVPVHLFVEQVRGQEQWTGLTFDLSEGGVYLCQRPQPIPHVLGLELNLPGLRDSIWTKAEVRYVGSHGRGFMGVGMAFTGMARKHQALLHDWLNLTKIRLRTDDRRSPVRQLLAA